MPPSKDPTEIPPIQENEREDILYLFNIVSNSTELQHLKSKKLLEEYITYLYSLRASPSKKLRIPYKEDHIRKLHNLMEKQIFQTSPC